MKFVKFTAWPYVESEIEEMYRVDSPNFKPYFYRHVFGAVKEGNLIQIQLLQKQLPNELFKMLMECESFQYKNHLIVVDQQPKPLGSLLHLACSQSSFQMVQYLVEEIGLNVTAMDSEGSNCLQVLFRDVHSFSTSVEKCCLVLLKKEPKLMESMVEIGYNIFTPLIHVAVSFNYNFLLKHLIDIIGIDVINHGSIDSAIVEACGSGFWTTFNALVQKGATIDGQRNLMDSNCLHKAVAGENYNQRIVDYLLFNHPQLMYEVDLSNNTPLQQVCLCLFLEKLAVFVFMHFCFRPLLEQCVNLKLSDS